MAITKIGSLLEKRAFIAGLSGYLKAKDLTPEEKHALVDYYKYTDKDLAHKNIAWENAKSSELGGALLGILGGAITGNRYLRLVEGSSPKSMIPGLVLGYGLGTYFGGNDYSKSFARKLLRNKNKSSEFRPGEADAIINRHAAKLDMDDMDFIDHAMDGTKEFKEYYNSITDIPERERLYKALYEA